MYDGNTMTLPWYMPGTHTPKSIALARYMAYNMILLWFMY